MRDEYICQLDTRGEGNPNYWSENLMTKIQRDDDVSAHLSFSNVKLSGCISMWLVYNASITVNDAVAAAYLAASKDLLKHAAITLRQLILKAFEESSDMPWPPTADELLDPSVCQVPEELTRFLNLIFAGQDSEFVECKKTLRLVWSIGQDVCHAVTNGEWKLLKHILSCTTIRHLYRSKQLMIILIAKAIYSD